MAKNRTAARQECSTVSAKAERSAALPQSQAATRQTATAAAASFHGVRLKGRRKAARLTQENLAGRLGVSISMVRRWEEGRAEPRAAALYDLSVTLKTAMEYFLGKIESPELIVPPSPDEAQLIANFQAIGKVGRQACIECSTDTRRVADICKRASILLACRA